MSKYMRGMFSYYGIGAPERKRLIQQVLKQTGIPEAGFMIPFLKLCWACEEREMQYAAMDILGKRKKFINEEYGRVFETLITEKSWWDTVDWLASHGVGHLFQNFPDSQKQYFPKWKSSDNLWLNRTTILFQLKYKDKTDGDLLFSTISHFKSHEDFFIRKACGWALRQYSKFNPNDVRQFIANTPGLSPLTIKEGSKYV